MKIQQEFKNGDKVENRVAELISVGKDAFSEWLDGLYGATVTDNTIFGKLPKYWEQEFHKDMDALNVSSLMYIIELRMTVKRLIELYTYVQLIGF